jgi:hypothetical protein
MIPTIHTHHKHNFSEEKPILLALRCMRQVCFLRVGCAAQSEEHSYKPPIRTLFMLNNVHAFDDPSWMDTYVISQHTGEPIDRLRRAEEFFHRKEQNEDSQFDRQHRATMHVVDMKKLEDASPNNGDPA